MNETFYEAFSLTWPASMQIYENKKRFYIRKESNSHRICLEHQYGRRDVMRKLSILSGEYCTKVLNRVNS